jgi:hypothetical protein
MSRGVILFIGVLSLVSVGTVGCMKPVNPDPSLMLDEKMRAAFGVSLLGKPLRQCSQALEKRFGLGSRKPDVVRELTAIAAARDDCELILSSEMVEGGLHYLSFVFHYEQSPSEVIVWRETIDFGFDSHEKLARVSGGSIMSIPRAEAPPWHPGK